jgi:hypothetical protein
MILHSENKVLKDELRTLKEDKKKLENNCNNLKRRVQEV